jgi:transcriptional regulator with XRE-family HTH domain
MTIRELTVALGYSASSNSYISEVENNKRSPRTEFIIKVADLFGVTVDQLVRDELEV